MCHFVESNLETNILMWKSGKFIMDEEDFNTSKHPDSALLSAVDNILLIMILFISFFSFT